MRFRELIVSVFLFDYVRCYLIKGSLDINNSSFVRKPINDGTAPAYFDWREGGFVSPVKDQQSCGACWAFSAVGSIESHVAIYWKLRVILSEQFLIDCEKEQTGCGNTTILKIFAQIVSDIGGVLQDKDYFPYSNRAYACRWNRDYQKLVPVIGYKRIHGEDQMVDYLYKNGPLSAAINSASMRHYNPRGQVVIDEPTDALCSPKKLDHAVVIVGYNEYVDPNTSIRTPYWIIKNSWGDQWGDHGFYYLVRGRNACGIAEDVSIPSVM
ncbi:unnamed protein product [Leptosia nina]|uniref:Peptidase C1A papain C-terminal domain-containing protein n=1 Tax=Leptosia nina TaxID=320188 RepID=A0AAV1IYQ5_9NEOP